MYITVVNIKIILKVGDDFVITYSLDNYITIQGIVNEHKVNDCGYLISNIEKTADGLIKYRGIEIDKSQYLMKDNLVRDNGNYEQGIKYQKINGVKYYYDASVDKWFSLLNGNEIWTSDKFNLEDDLSAYNYYNEAFEFMKRIENLYNLSGLTTDSAVDKELQSSGYKIFDIDKNNIEESNSNFNQHRLAVIRYTIEKNLSIAIANYNNYTNVKTDFLMPELKEDEWDKILNNISVISFMQGLSIGGKIYNGYAIVNNNNNEEVVSENAIYIANTSDSTYHNILEMDLNNKLDDSYIGVFNIDLQKKLKKTDVSTQYYYPKLYYADYNSVVYQTNVVNLDEYDGNIYKYMDENKKLAKVYYTALGRERYSMYKVNKNVNELLQKYK